MTRNLPKTAPLVALGMFAASSAAVGAMVPAPGELDLELDRTLSIDGTEMVTDDTIVAPAMLQDEAAPDTDWASKFILGLAASGGNTDSQNFNVAVTSRREDAENRTALNAGYYFGASNGDRDENEFTAGILHDWLLPDSDWFYFAEARFDYDEFQSWESRINGHGGVGYELIREDDLDVTLRAGLGAVKEFNSDNDDVRFEGLLGADVVWRITDKQTFEAGTRIYPDFDETGEFRTLSYAQWALLVDDEANLSLNVRFEHEHQSVVDTNRDKNDYRVIAGIQFDF